MIRYLPISFWLGKPMLSYLFFQVFHMHFTMLACGKISLNAIVFGGITNFTIRTLHAMSIQFY